MFKLRYLPFLVSLVNVSSLTAIAITTPACGYVDSKIDADGDGWDVWNDCDDANAAIFPNATEFCDGLDNDCNDSTDENHDFDTLYKDGDGDGQGDPNNYIVSCDEVAGYVTFGRDCDDNRADVYYGGIDVCDGANNDCQGEADDVVLYGSVPDPENPMLPWYLDSDGDGYGNDVTAGHPNLFACTKPDGYAATADDCVDYNSSINPGADEVCDASGLNYDENCDGQVDEIGAVDADEVCYVDADGDGLGSETDPTVLMCNCGDYPGFSFYSLDCDDTNPEIYYWAPELCDGLDNDCDGGVDTAHFNDENVCDEP